MVERPGGRAADDPDPDAGRAQEEEHAADGGALAGAARADLVLLELAVVVEGQDPDVVAVDDAGVLQRHGGVVGGEFVREDGEHELTI